MLELTEQAIVVIRDIVENGDVGPDGGLRISGSHEGNGETALDFELAPEPSADDEVGRDGGAVVFLDLTAAAMLAEARLDAHAHGDHFHFSVEEQDAAD